MSSKRKTRIRGKKLKMSEESDEESSNGIRAPIIGYEVVDRREKFTVFKIHVSDRNKSWFVFRRYTDFIRLNDKLQDVFPGFHFKLPSKRWFKNNFDPDFIEDRAHGLQFFINNVMHHGTICTSDIVKEFLCLDDPPGPYDSLEESRAYCQQLEDDIDDMKEKVHDLTSELSATKSQLLQARVQQEALVNSLKEERSSRSGRNSATSSGTSESFRAIGSDHKGISSHREGLDSRETDPARRNIGSSRGNTWLDSLDVTSHSNGVHKIKPAQRSSNVLQPLTSTPEKDSDSKPFQNEDNSLLEVSREGNNEGAFGSDNSALNSNRDTVDHIELEEDETDKSTSNSAQILEEAPDAEHKPIQKELTEKSTEQDKSTRKSKRDSGIIFDSSPSPTTIE